ncbi:MAG: hypothetical protein IJU95_04715 [Treponema sp.]|nr:hypothetical protein [Treponema sp.]
MNKLTQNIISRIERLASVSIMLTEYEDRNPASFRTVDGFDIAASLSCLLVDEMREIEEMLVMQARAPEPDKGFVDLEAFHEAAECLRAQKRIAETAYSGDELPGTFFEFAYTTVDKLQRLASSIK